MAIGYLAHSFDLLNVRDLDLVAQVGERCATVVAGVLSDDLVEAQYGRRPVVPLTERMALVGHLRGVDQVVEQTSLSLPAEVVAYAGTSPLCFVVAGEPPVLEGPTAIALVPGRQTASDVVRATLAPVVEQAVAS